MRRAGSTRARRSVSLPSLHLELEAPTSATHLSSKTITSSTLLLDGYSPALLPPPPPPPHSSMRVSSRGGGVLGSRATSSASVSRLAMGMTPEFPSLSRERHTPSGLFDRQRGERPISRVVRTPIRSAVKYARTPTGFSPPNTRGSLMPLSGAATPSAPPPPPGTASDLEDTTPGGGALLAQAQRWPAPLGGGRCAGGHVGGGFPLDYGSGASSRKPPDEDSSMLLASRQYSSQHLNGREAVLPTGEGGEAAAPHTCHATAGAAAIAHATRGHTEVVRRTKGSGLLQGASQGRVPTGGAALALRSRSSQFVNEVTTAGRLGAGMNVGHVRIPSSWRDPPLDWVIRPELPRHTETATRFHQLARPASLHQLLPPYIESSNVHHGTESKPTKLKKSVARASPLKGMPSESQPWVECPSLTGWLPRGAMPHMITYGAGQGRPSNGVSSPVALRFTRRDPRALRAEWPARELHESGRRAGRTQELVRSSNRRLLPPCSDEFE